MKQTKTPAFDLDAARMIRAMNVARSTAPTRHYLRGVRVEPITGGGVWMVATDGHTMLIQRDRKGHAAHAATLAITEPAFTPYENYDGELITSQEWTGNRFYVPHLKPGDTVAAQIKWGTRLQFSGGHVLAERLEENFPDWRMITNDPPVPVGQFEAKTPPDRVGLSVYSLAALTAGQFAFRTHGDRNTPGALFLTFDNEPDALGVIMQTKMHPKTPRPLDILTEITRTAPATKEARK